MTHPLNIIGLAGPAGCGKDTVAAMLASEAGHHCVAFADALRGEVCAAFDIPESFLTERDTKEHPIGALALSKCADLAFVWRMVQLDEAGTISLGSLEHPRSPRQIMQWWGTDYRRAQNVEHWTSQLLFRIDHLQTKGVEKFAITDVRFADEAEYVRRLGGQIWQITRPGFEVAQGAHESEKTGAEFQSERVIVNDGDLFKLLLQVRAVLCAEVAA